jgi:hypothetical protein
MWNLWYVPIVAFGMLALNFFHQKSMRRQELRNIMRQYMPLEDNDSVLV